MTDFFSIRVGCLRLIPNGMNIIVLCLFSTELYCLRQILPPCIIRIALVFIHLRSSALSAGVNYQKNPVRDVTERNNVGAWHNLSSSWNPVRD
jgi:hypothetical protein